jgi:hypothetical protein
MIAGENFINLLIRLNHSLPILIASFKTSVDGVSYVQILGAF